MRDYGIRLMDALPGMSWREFEVLLHGLNPHGAVAAHYAEAMKRQATKQPRSRAEQQAAANSFWASVASI